MQLGAHVIARARTDARATPSTPHKDSRRTPWEQNRGVRVRAAGSCLGVTATDGAATDSRILCPEGHDVRTDDPDNRTL